MSGTELKVVMLVTRKTLGWFDPLSNERKTQDYISQSQFVEMTGQSHTAIAQAIQSAVEHGWIIAKDKNGALCDTAEKRRRRKVWYQLGNIFTKKISKQESGLDEKDTEKSKQQNVVHLSKKADNTKETITKEINTAKSDRQLFAGSDTKITQPDETGKDINALLARFKGVNPSYQNFYGNNTQRNCLKRMVKAHGQDKVARIIESLKMSNGKRFAPTITTPKELEDNLGKLIAFWRKEKQEKQNEKPKVTDLTHLK